jgi:hypothetical protein
LLESLPLMPEWYLAIAVMGLLSAAGAFWSPLLLALPLLGAALAALLIDAGLGAARARFPAHRGRAPRRLLTAFLYLAQPLVRLEGRIAHGLTPWRRRGPAALGLPLPRTYAFWSETWQSTEDRVRAVSAALRAEGSVVRSGGDWDRWDLEARGGILGGARLRLAIEDHGAGRQLMRLRSWPHVSRVAITLGAFLSALAGLALLSGAHAVAGALGLLAVALGLRLAFECGAATVTIRKALDRTSPEETTIGPQATVAPQPRPIGIALD